MTLDRLRRRAAQTGARLLLVGADGSRLGAVAEALRGDGHTSVRVVGPDDLVPARHPRLASVAALLRAREPDRVRDGIHALDLAVDPLRFATALLALDEAEALVAGSEIDPGRLAEAALWTLGPSPDGAPPGSATWIALEEGRLVACADCVFPMPAAPADRARLALAAASLAGHGSGERTRVTFLAGPAIEEGAAANAALAAFEALAPGIPAVADPRLLIESGDQRFRGRAEVLIFPTSTAGHLACRAVRAMAGAGVLGPVLLGVPGVVAATAEDADDGELAGTAALAALLSERTTT